MKAVLTKLITVVMVMCVLMLIHDLKMQVYFDTLVIK